MFQFPANPVFDQLFVPVGGPTYKWNGKAWVPFSSTISGTVNFTGPVRFGDGTLAAPSITWVNETNSGFYRSGEDNFQAVVNAQHRWGWNQNSFFMQAGTTFNANTATFSGMVSANISGTAARLYTKGDTSLTAMAFHWTGQTADQPNWIWGGRDSDPANMYVWQPTALNVAYATRAYYAHRVYINADNAQASIAFTWSGQGGQPTWIWGAADQSNTYLYNPSNFSVNYANSADNSNKVGGIGPWNWSNRQKNPVHLWANDGATNDQFLVAPGNINVNYANSCDNANKVCGYGGWRYVNAGNGPVYLWATDGNGQDHYLCHRASMSVNYANSAGSTGTINNASGGQINGRMLAYHSAWGGGNADGAWHGMPVVAQSNGGAYPGVGIHREGYYTWTMCIYYDGDLWFGSNTNEGSADLGSWAAKLQRNGYWRCRGYTSTSSLMTNVQPMTGALADVLNLHGVRGYNEETKRPDIALVSADMERVFPELVNEERAEDGTTGKSYNYIALISPMVEAIRVLNERLTALEAR